jgi:cobalt-zinc-cadmium resistance protein CzcA
MPQYRDSVEGIKNIPIETAARAMIPLRDLADVKIASGASYIYRENNHRYIPIKFSVRGRDLGSTVAEAQTNVQRDVKLPSGYEAEWSGEFGELKEAEARLAYIVPLSLLLIVILLYSTFNSVRDTALVILSIPFAVTGGIWALFLTHINFSVSAAVGFISLFGVAVMEGIILISYYNQLQDKKTPEEDALMRAASVRMRPVLMTCMSACIGLLPAAVSTGIGSQTQRPLATVIVGGMLLTPVLILLFVPVLLAFLPQKSAAKRRETDELHYGDASV